MERSKTRFRLPYVLQVVDDLIVAAPLPGAGRDARLRAHPVTCRVEREGPGTELKRVHVCVGGLLQTDPQERKDHHCFFGLQNSSHSPGPRCVTRQ